MTLARNVFGVLDRSAESHYRNDVALSVDGVDRTFTSVRDRSLRLARALDGHGIQRGDRVAVMLSNRHEWPEIFFGLAALGAVCVPVNVLLTPAEIDHVCEDSDARCLFVDHYGESGLASLSVLPDSVITVGEVETPEGTNAKRYEDLIAAAQLASVPGPALDDDAIQYYSSGTTGLPKAAVHTHNGVLWNSFGQLRDLRLTPEVVYIVVPSLAWAAGFHNLMLALSWIGGRSVIMSSGSMTPDRLMSAIEDAGGTHIMLVPSLLRQFTEDGAILERMRRSTLRWVVTGAEPVPRALIELINDELPDCRVCQGYGLSEFPTIATLLHPDEALDHHGSAGRPLSHTQVAVQTDDGSCLLAGLGELLIRSPATMRGYYNQPEQTEEAFRDGWLHTGDLAAIDDEGFVSIVGRTKDMIISGGINIYPKEIEDVISRIPGVLEVAVVGVPDERFGEAPVAVIVAAAEADVDVVAIEAACRERLAPFKCPRRFLVRAEPLPRNPTGKILKRVLRPWAAAESGVVRR
jgi:fatty-acyl-CoA synthase